MHFSLLKREKKYHGKIIDLTVDHLQYPSGTTTVREIIEHPGGAVILCLFDNSDILLIRQYRHPFAQDVIELPAGKLDAGEDPLICAQRELREETGFAARHWEKMTALYATPGFCNEVLHLFLARDLYHHKDGQALEEGEASIRVLRVPLGEAFAMIDRQEIVDGKTIAGIFLAARKIG
ncbi:MAG: NUDIX hydrolase [Bacteriovoracaceae bacterium]